jgi:predicted Zn-dependent protease
MKRAPLLLGIAALAAMTSCKTVPYTGRHNLVLISAGQEQQMGLDAYKDALSKAKLSTDAAAVERVKRVGQRLAAAANRPDFQWEFNLLDDPKTVNAWCLPGGKVAVYSGILPVAKDDAGLAVVMGHEIGHALARHGSERMSQGLIAQAGGTLLDVAMSQKPSQTRALYQQAYGGAVQVGALLPFSRAQESEADHIGLILMSEAGYDPRAAAEFWGRMAQAGGGGGEGLQKYLSTHPSHGDRIKQIEGWLPEAQQHYKPR